MRCWAERRTWFCAMPPVRSLSTSSRTTGHHKEIRRKRMRIVILGCGRLGSRLVNQLVKQGHQLVIVDQNEAKFKNLEEKQPVLKVTGNVFNEEILAKAFTEKADIFIPVTGKDNVNIM